jgi:twitching motility two-component system response regulator PilH
MARVLVVDDSPTDLKLVKGLLEESGFEVETVDNPNDALSIAHDRPPDLILMDVVFEGMSGFQATRKLTKDPATSPIPVIIMSVKDQESDRIWGLRQGAVEYLVKPVRAKQLVETVQTVLKTRGVS